MFLWFLESHRDFCQHVRLCRTLQCELLPSLVRVELFVLVLVLGFGAVILRSVDGNKLETVEIVESDGDGGVSIGTGDCCGEGAVETVRGTKRPVLSRRSDEARLKLVGCSSGDSGQRKVL